MTRLTKPVSRLTEKRINGKPIVITLRPGTDKREATIALRRLGERMPYTVALSDIYRLAALWHGTKERIARGTARKNGIPWRRARREFMASL